MTWRAVAGRPCLEALVEGRSDLQVGGGGGGHGARRRQPGEHHLGGQRQRLLAEAAQAEIESKT